MAKISSIAFRVYNMNAMLAFYSEAFNVQFQEVDTYGIRSQFGDLDGITLKFVPLRESDDFKNFPTHQPGFVVSDVEAVIAIASSMAAARKGRPYAQTAGSRQPSLRDPDGNTIELAEG